MRGVDAISFDRAIGCRVRLKKWWVLVVIKMIGSLEFQLKGAIPLRCLTEVPVRKCVSWWAVRDSNL